MRGKEPTDLMRYLGTIAGWCLCSTLLVPLGRPPASVVVDAVRVSSALTWHASPGDYAATSNQALSPTALILGGYWALPAKAQITGTLTFSG